MAVASGLIPIKDVPKAIVIALKGRELGVPPMQAFSQINVIQGKPAVGAELQVALIYRKFPNAKIQILETNDRICRISVQRPGEDSEEWKFTYEDAVKLQLHTKDNYKKQPATMLRWRCLSAMARAKFPDALMGLSHTPEELDPNLELNEEGEVIDAPRAQTRPSTPHDGDSPNREQLNSAEPAGASISASDPKAELKAKYQTNYDVIETSQGVIFEGRGNSVISNHMSPIDNPGFAKGKPLTPGQVNLWTQKRKLLLEGEEAQIFKSLNIQSAEQFNHGTFNHALTMIDHILHDRKK